MAVVPKDPGGDLSADGFRTRRPEHNRDTGKGSPVRNSLREALFATRALD